ncbi:Alanine--tRNA ligase, mitochondrial [Aphelenchoides bicaudatus]|nr:Alanine--tRNA ligase, mitochondrial [Aphelenchoides bicaudatus]
MPSWTSSRKDNTLIGIPRAPFPHEDPTLLFANAGMNQFKPIFQGTVGPDTDMGKLKRAVNTQKCIRAGGKHNDLDDVGKDVYHHTFFEMLGNWSFGDYFKKEICNWAWELLTVKLGIPGERLYVSYFGGDKEAGLEPDNDCKQIWLDIGVPESRILPFGMKDNFWEMGDVGPCGPCSEIHYDRVGGRDASSLVNMDDPLVVEIWNLVFIQFNREEGGVLRSLPQKHIDCGLGLERLVAVMQNKTSNYDTDLFVPIFDAIREKTGVRAYTGKVGAEDVDGIDMAYLTKGRPDKDGRGYVLRRILRRAVRYFKEKLNGKPGVLSSLVSVVVDVLGGVFPELTVDPQSVCEVIDDEEAQFLRTLVRGETLFNKAVSKLPAGSKVLPGNVAWRLYDTFGFPVDLTQLMAEEKGLQVDLVEYEEEKKKAAIISAAGSGKFKGASDISVHLLDELKKNGIPRTDDSPKYIYTDDGKKDVNASIQYVSNIILCAVGKILAIIQDGKAVDTLKDDEEAAMILDKTCFYAEQGGQIYDKGVFTKTGDKSTMFNVENTQTRAGYIIFFGKSVGSFAVGDEVDQTFDQEERWLTMKNHTGTHVLNYALNSVLGSVDQKGSLVAPDRMRFDFTSVALKPEQVKKVEEIAQSLIDTQKPVYAKECKTEEAREINGLRAVFGETYPNPVRVVSVGTSVEDLLANPTSDLGTKTSVEFCGGTHLRNVGHIGRLVITSEESIAKGVRRIVAVTGPKGEQAFQRANRFGERTNELLKRAESDPNVVRDAKQFRALTKEIFELNTELNESDLPYWRREELREVMKKIDTTLIAFDKKAKAEIANKVLEEAKKLNEEAKDNFVVHVFEKGANVKALDAAFKQLKNHKAVMGFALNEDGQKFLVSAKVDKSLAEGGFKALDWINKVCEIADGRGGGKEQQANATCNSVGKIDDAVKIAREFASLSIKN